MVKDLLAAEFPCIKSRHSPSAAGGAARRPRLRVRAHSAVGGLQATAGHVGKDGIALHHLNFLYRINGNVEACTDSFRHMKGQPGLPNRMMAS